MSKPETVLETSNKLKALADDIRGQDTSLGGEIDLLAEELAGLAGPPARNFAEFDIAGDEVEIPEQGTSILERVIGESDFLPASFLELGSITQRAVARVVLKVPVGGLPPGSGLGTGFMVSSDLFVTNNHVIPDTNFATDIRVQFNFQLGMDGVELPTESFEFDAGGVFHTNVPLDYTIMQLRRNPSPVVNEPPLSAGNKWGSIQLRPEVGYFRGQHFNVVQHPAGRRKEIAIQDNTISSLFTNVVRYTADTEPGSSGSPVFDNLWRLVALHHAGGDRDAQGTWLNNEGIRVDRIVEDLRNQFSALPEVLSELGITS